MKHKIILKHANFSLNAGFLNFILLITCTGCWAISQKASSQYSYRKTTICSVLNFSFINCTGCSNKKKIHPKVKKKKPSISRKVRFFPEFLSIFQSSWLDKTRSSDKDIGMKLFLVLLDIKYKYLVKGNLRTGHLEESYHFSDFFFMHFGVRERTKRSLATRILGWPFFGYCLRHLMEVISKITFKKRTSRRKSAFFLNFRVHFKMRGGGGGGEIKRSLMIMIFKWIFLLCCLIKNKSY